jgi:hypothetical protein
LSATPETNDSPWHLPALILGGLLAAIGISGFLDDSGLVNHPSWFIAVTVLVAASLAAAIHTVKRLLRPDHT